MLIRQVFFIFETLINTMNSFKINVMTNQDLLSEEFCFKTNYIIPDVDKHWECLKKYSNETERINNRKDNFKIFVDTNFLLKYYEISLESRRKLFDYINKNKNRIVITKQVEKEFIK